MRYSAAAVAGMSLVTGFASVAEAQATPSVSPMAFDFNKTFSTMSLLKPIAAAGTGKVAFLLPDTQSSVRWVDFDAPYLKKAMLDAGVPASDIIVENALGSDTTQATQAQAAITAGAKVIGITSLDSTTGDAIEKTAGAAGVKTLDYDRLNLGGSASVYVSFNNVQRRPAPGPGPGVLASPSGTSRTRRCSSSTARPPTTTPRSSPRATTRC